MSTGYFYTGTSQGAATATGLSTQILIQVDGQGIGAIQSLQVNEQRGTTRITEVGTDGVIEIVPSKATEISLTVERIVFDRKTMTEAFSRAFLHIHSQRIPFDIMVYDFTSAISNTPSNSTEVLDLTSSFDAAAGSEGVITTVFENCWFTSLASTYSSADYVIAQNANIDCEFVRSFVDGNEDQHASLGVPALFDALEALADRGRRGSMDARGLGRLEKDFGNLLNP